MSANLGQVLVTPLQSPYPPLAVGFFGLATGYLIWGPMELFDYPKRNASVDFGTGIWGIWMTGFMQFFTGVYLFAGLTLFGTFRTPAFYMAALAFTAYGVHWFAIGWNRARQIDQRVNVGMAVAFTLIGILGIIVFFGAHDNPVAGVFIGLTCVYIADFFASLRPDFETVGLIGQRATGFFRLGTGFWLIYMTYAVTLDFALGYTLPT
jgi:hypothetical protein